ncbi:sigma-54-dependent transcriptional regulator [Desulfovibrio psychrotolerans]|uniref:Sigma-54-dependent Fis family transcriptional regulator n=1 Tax=Desulfovibrio psychrotolerans TaxID=415242 RepID=A0A7J0BR20_9BACT|nr:sigma-54 dependent transcriptional regulator [Desulfovibrio psychrotolerans]GFM36167.1 sigma-54-dependent Fis family transcriptional regulator [Desulfovibrio psychrotolerans]
MSLRRILFLAPAASVTHIFPRLKEAGYEVGLAENLKGASAFIRKSGPGVIFSRPQLPGYKVEDLLAVSQDDPAFPPVIVFSDKGSVDEAERFLGLGAHDYWLEPLLYEKVVAAVPSARKAAPVPQATTLGGRRPLPAEQGGGGLNIIGSNPVMRRVLALARQVAPSRATVLISGESGTGKEMFSRYLHACSDRAQGPFVAVNCAALPEHLLESELFGHEKGAFTGAIARKLGKFELASGGTLLLDEISEMDLGLQAKLLRVLQEGEVDRVGGTETVKVDVRVLATTNRNLEDWVREGKFRQDLFFRLNVIPLRLPALRERGEDAIELARFFVDMYVREYGLGRLEFSQEALDWLTEYDWPGNVRELQNLMERASLLAGRGPVRKEHFLLDPDSWPLFAEDDGAGESADGAEGGYASAAASGAAGGMPGVSGVSGGLGSDAAAGAGDAVFGQAVIPLHEMERIMILKGLELTSGNRTQAAEILGISVRTLRNKLNEYRGAGLDIP